MSSFEFKNHFIVARLKRTGPNAEYRRRPFKDDVTFTLPAMDAAFLRDRYGTSINDITHNWGGFCVTSFMKGPYLRRHFPILVSKVEARAEVLQIFGEFHLRKPSLRCHYDSSPALVDFLVQKTWTDAARAAVNSRLRRTEPRTIYIVMRRWWR